MKGKNEQCILFTSIFEIKKTFFIKIASPIEPEWITESAKRYAESVNFNPLFTPIETLRLNAGGKLIKALNEPLKMLLPLNKPPSPNTCDLEYGIGYLTVVGLRSVIQEKQEAIHSLYKEALGKCKKEDEYIVYKYGHQIKFGSGCKVVVSNRVETTVIIKEKDENKLKIAKGIQFSKKTKWGHLVNFVTLEDAASFKAKCPSSKYGNEIWKPMSKDELEFFKTQGALNFSKDIKVKYNGIKIRCSTLEERKKTEDYLDKVFGEYSLYVSEQISQRTSLTNGRFSYWEKLLHCFIEFNQKEKKFTIKGENRQQAAQSIRSYLHEQSRDTWNEGEGRSFCCTDCGFEKEVINLSLCGHTTCLRCLEERIDRHVKGKRFPVTCLVCGNDILITDLKYFSEQARLFRSSFECYQKESSYKLRN